MIFINKTIKHGNSVKVLRWPVWRGGREVREGHIRGLEEQIRGWDGGGRGVVGRGGAR